MEVIEWCYVCLNIPDKETHIQVHVVVYMKRVKHKSMQCYKKKKTTRMVPVSSQIVFVFELEHGRMQQ